MTLFAHQIQGAEWLAQRDKAYLGDTPGLGKTRTLIKGLGGGGRLTLVVCPAIVRTHWAREFAALGYKTPEIKSYDEIVRGGYGMMREMLLDGIDTLVLDEAHYCKHPTSQRSQLLLGKDGYSRRVPRVWLASGTPQPKNPRELFTQLCYLIPEVLSKHKVARLEDWTERFCVTRPVYVRGTRTEKVVGVRNAEELKEILSTVMLRRTLDDVGIDVPPLFWQTLRLDAEDARLAIIPEMGLVETHSIVAEAIRSGDLESIAADPHVARMRRRLGELKVVPVAQMLTSQLADSDEKVVVFAHHHSVLKPLRELLGSFGVAYVDGDVGGRARDEAIDRFQSDPRTRVFLGQNIACQTGITLHAARRVVLVEPDWTAVTNEQLGKRVARIGQKATRCVAQMVALAGTLDEAIVGQCEREVRMAGEVGL